MKPTHGLCPYTGIVLLESTIDTTGPITRNVMDNALLLRVMAGTDGIDDRQQAGCPLPSQVPDYTQIATQGVEGLKIAIVEESLSGPLHDERYASMVVEAASKLETLGAKVERVSIPDVLLAPDLWMVSLRETAFCPGGCIDDTADHSPRSSPA
jgi:amidase